MGEELLFTTVAQHLLTYKRAPEIFIQQMNESTAKRNGKEILVYPLSPLNKQEDVIRLYVHYMLRLYSQ